MFFMRFKRQLKWEGPFGFTSLKTGIPAAAGYVQRREVRWESIRTSYTFQWASDHEGKLTGWAQGKQEVHGPPPGQRIVLHIDDDEDDRMLLEEALQKLDPRIKVQQVDNGSTALSLLKQSKEVGNLPCLIILDINMPGMNGKEVLKEIKKDQELASLPLILFSTSSEFTYSEFVKTENVEFITKPLNSSELFDSARKMLQHCPPH
jgi:CheY-like chemotaxis protein